MIKSSDLAIIMSNQKNADTFMKLVLHLYRNPKIYRKNKNKLDYIV